MGADSKLLHRFWAKVEKTEGCWCWIGAKTRDGYGRFSAYGYEIMAARFAYEQEYGPVPPDMRIGHICENPSCVRPSHLVAKSQREITLGGISPAANNAAKSMCKHGHLLRGKNLYVDPQGKRKCVTCKQKIAASRKTRFAGPRKPKPGKVVLRIQMERMTFIELGEHYKVTDTTVRNWAKSYGLW